MPLELPFDSKFRINPGLSLAGFGQPGRLRGFYPRRRLTHQPAANPHIPGIWGLWDIEYHLDPQQPKVKKCSSVIIVGVEIVGKPFVPLWWPKRALAKFQV